MPTQSAVSVDGVAPARLRWAAPVLAVVVTLFVGAAGFAGAAMYPYLTDRALVTTKETIARAAIDAITTLWSYTPENIDALPDRAAKYLSGDFEAKYRQYIETIAGASKQLQQTVSTEVTGVAVISVTGATASALVYTNTRATSPKTREIPGVQYWSHQVSMARSHGRWLATDMAQITKFSVTPQF